MEILAMQADSGSAGTGIILLFLAIIIYFLPAAAAWNKQSFGAVLALNFFLGWTFVGWVIALAWALKDPELKRAPGQVIAQQVGSPRLCSTCGKYSTPESKFCSSCGMALV
jgi:hypothetical protein